MTDPTAPRHDEPAEGPRDDAFSASGGAETADDGSGGAKAGGWSSPGGAGTGATSGGATAILESLRDAIDDLVVRATPTVKEVSVKAAELVGTAADKAAPLARKAGEATAEASSTLADRSRSWASGVRDSLRTEGAQTASAPGTATTTAEDVTPTRPPEADVAEGADAGDPPPA